MSVHEEFDLFAKHLIQGILKAYDRFALHHPLAPHQTGFVVVITPDAISLEASRDEHKRMMQEHFDEDQRLKNLLNSIHESFNSIRPEALASYKLTAEITSYLSQKRGVYHSLEESSVECNGLPKSITLLNAFQRIQYDPSRLPSALFKPLAKRTPFKTYHVIRHSHTIGETIATPFLARSIEEARHFYIAMDRPNMYKEALATEDWSLLAKPLNKISIAEASAATLGEILAEIPAPQRGGEIAATPTQEA